MQVFNLYFKLLRRNLKSIFIYVFCFMAIFCAFTIYYKSDESSKGYESIKVDIAVFDHDQSIISKGLVSYLSDKANIIELEDSEQSQKDALFYDHVSYIVTIPEGFSTSFASGEGRVDTQQKPDSIYGFMLDNYISDYLNNTHAYLNLNPNASMNEIHTMVQTDLQKQVDVSIYPNTALMDDDIAFDSDLKNIFFNYLTYMFLAIIILTVGIIMKEMNQHEVRMRNIASPLKMTTYNMQLLAANLCFCSMIWLLFMVLITLLSSQMLNIQGYLYMLNSYVFMMVCLGMSYLVSAIFSNMKHADDALNGVAQIASLGSSFLCGAFIPQAIISKGVLLFASFTPAYWFIRFNDELRYITEYNWDTLSSVFGYIGIQLLFAVTFVVLALVVTKSKRRSQEI